MQGFPYWLDFERPVFRTLDGDRTAGAVVIGAGIAGLKLARCLARYGFEVAVLEGARVGEGASSRNQGSINHGPSMNYRDCIQRHSRPIAQGMWRLGLENQRLLEAQIAEYEIDCDYEVAGMTFLARSDIEASNERLDAYRADYELLREDGFAVDRLDAQEARAAGGSPLYVGGLRYRSDAQFHSGRFVVGLAVGVARHPKLRIYEGCRVRSIERQGAATRVATSAGNVTAPVVFLATNALVPQDVPALTRALRAERGQVFVTEVLPRAAMPGQFWHESGLVARDSGSRARIPLAFRRRPHARRARQPVPAVPGRRHGPSAARNRRF
jgi:gamma-glutamylputrescine oxidase